ncbi:hypothetical protein [Streptomyces sp. NPDC127038]|uniref:hypothetical protein n=1 Tax=Streptomyces sp. NPDC127038 TaxID=3347114 RepID=UPI00364DC30D
MWNRSSIPSAIALADPAADHGPTCPPKEPAQTAVQVGAFEQRLAYRMGQVPRAACFRHVGGIPEVHQPRNFRGT